MPDLSFEAQIRNHNGLDAAAPVAGVDEAGRGPWAGPVVAGAVILAPDSAIRLAAAGLTDSKALKGAKREALLAIIEAECPHGVGIASVEEIDRFNILQATFLAMRRAVLALPTAPAAILIDGNRLPPDLPAPAATVVKGDARSLSIAAASIVAKVTRDRIMVELAAAHPEFGWQKNAGYGTKIHQEALERLGPTPHHRKSFAPIRALLDKI